MRIALYVPMNRSCAETEQGAKVYVHSIGYLFALATGLVFSGLIASLWELVSDEPLSFNLIARLDLLSPLRGLILAVSLPCKLSMLALSKISAQPFAALAALAIAGLWSFMQGVVIMTQVFGVR